MFIGDPPLRPLPFNLLLCGVTVLVVMVLPDGLKWWEEWEWVAWSRRFCETIGTPEFGLLLPKLYSSKAAAD